MFLKQQRQVILKCAVGNWADIGGGIAGDKAGAKDGSVAGGDEDGAAWAGGVDAGEEEDGGDDDAAGESEGLCAEGCCAVCRGECGFLESLLTELWWPSSWGRL